METLQTTHVPEVATTSNNKSKYVTLVEKIYQAENRPQGYGGTIESLLWSSFSKMSKKRNTWKRATFKELLLHMYAQGCYKVLRNPIYVEVLINISTYGLKMVRPVQRWQRPSFDPEEQLEDLIDHCFAKYPTPVFLISSFYESSLRHQLWYVQLGSGRSVKSLNGLPEEFTAKMMHEFRNTPQGFSVSEAIVRAQALGYGATEQITMELTRSKLPQYEGNGAFWRSVIQFFSVQKAVNHWDLYKVLEYLENNIQRNRRFTMRGRTLDALLRQANEWHIAMQKMRNNANYLSWLPSGVKEMHHETEKEGKKVIYIAKELLSSEELYQEGSDMNHCVADYIDDCYAKKTSIFSLQKQEGDTIKKLATVEINPHTYEVLQAEGNSNTGLSSEASIAYNHWMDILGVDDKVTVYNQDQQLPPNPPVQMQHERVAPQPVQQRNQERRLQVPAERREVRRFPQNRNYGQGPPAPIGDFDVDATAVIGFIFLIIKILMLLIFL